MVYMDIVLLYRHILHVKMQLNYDIKVAGWYWPFVAYQYKLISPKMASIPILVSGGQ